MKFFLAFIAISMLYINVSAQEDTTMVSFVAYWNKGDQYNFKVSKIKKQWKADSLVKNDTNSYVANFEVLDSTDTSYKIKWTYQNNLKGDYNIPDELLEKFSKYDLTEVIYKTTETGSFVEIENWEEISEMMKSLFSDLTEYMEKETGDIEKLNQALQPLIAAYSSKQGIEQMVLKELQVFHMPMGLVFPSADTLRYEDQIATMLSDKPIRADGKIYFDQVDFEDAYCIMKQELQLNAEDTRNFLVNLFTKMGLSNDEVSKAYKNAKFDIVDHNHYEYFYNPCIPYYIETVRNIIIEIEDTKGHAVEALLIEMQDDE